MGGDGRGGDISGGGGAGDGIERTMSWLAGYRRLSPRYKRNPRDYLAFLGLAAALCCYKRFVRLAT
jgi:hypothetical protein